jgi:N-acetylneuraminate synthase
MPEAVSIGDRKVGAKQPVFVIAEIGINHNGNLEIAKRLIEAASAAGCDAVKFQKRTPDLCIPDSYRGILRETPWGIISYLEYRQRIEFRENEYRQIDSYCSQIGIPWFASCWDLPSVEFMASFNPPCYKVSSAMLTNHDLIRRINSKGVPVILSTGMSTMAEIRQASALVDPQNLLIAHCTSSYPSKNEELNLRMIRTLMDEFNNPIGYSGHEVGLQTTLAAVVLGASFIERHITLDRAMWGSDQAASVEPHGFTRLVRDIRVIESALGDGVKRVYDSELAVRDKLRYAK